MGMKTILALMEKHDGMQSMLETALLLARRYGSYVEGVPLRLATPDLTFRRHQQSKPDDARRAVPWS